MHIIIIHVYVCPKQVVLLEKWHFSLLVKIAKRKLVLAAIVMATTINNNRLKSNDFRDHCHRECSTASACNNPSDNITGIRYFGTVRLLRPKTKQKPIC